MHLLGHTLNFSGGRNHNFCWGSLILPLPFPKFLDFYVWEVHWANGLNIKRPTGLKLKTAIGEKPPVPRTLNRTKDAKTEGKNNLASFCAQCTQKRGPKPCKNLEGPPISSPKHLHFENAIMKIMSLYKSWNCV